MRLAIVIASSYKKSQLPSMPAAPLDSELVARRLAEPDTGTLVVKQLTGDRNLPERLAQLLAAQGQILESVLLYFIGYLAWMGNRTPAVLLDAPRARAFPLGRVCRLLERCTSDALLVLDTMAVLDETKAQADVADAVEAVLTEHALNVGLLMRGAVREPEPEGEGSEFTKLLVKALDRAASKRGSAALTTRGLYSMMSKNRRHADVFASTRFRAASPDFVLLPAGTPEVDSHPLYAEAPEEVTPTGLVVSNSIPAEPAAQADANPASAAEPSYPSGSPPDRHPRYFEDVDEVTGVKGLARGAVPTEPTITAPTDDTSAELPREDTPQVAVQGSEAAFGNEVTGVHERKRVVEAEPPTVVLQDADEVEEITAQRQRPPGLEQLEHGSGAAAVAAEANEVDPSVSGPVEVASPLHSLFEDVPAPPPEPTPVPLIEHAPADAAEEPLGELHESEPPVQSEERVGGVGTPATISRPPSVPPFAAGPEPVAIPELGPPPTLAEQLEPEAEAGPPPSLAEQLEPEPEAPPLLAEQLEPEPHQAVVEQAEPEAPPSLAEQFEPEPEAPPSLAEQFEPEPEAPPSLAEQLEPEPEPEPEAPPSLAEQLEPEPEPAVVEQAEPEPVAAEQAEAVLEAIPEVTEPEAPPSLAEQPEPEPGAAEQTETVARAAAELAAPEAEFEAVAEATEPEVEAEPELEAVATDAEPELEAVSADAEAELQAVATEAEPELQAVAGEAAPELEAVASEVEPELEAVAAEPEPELEAVAAEPEADQAAEQGDERPSAETLSGVLDAAEAAVDATAAGPVAQEAVPPPTEAEPTGVAAEAGATPSGTAFETPANGEWTEDSEWPPGAVSMVPAPQAAAEATSAESPAPSEGSSSFDSDMQAAIDVALATAMAFDALRESQPDGSTPVDIELGAVPDEHALESEPGEAPEGALSTLTLEETLALGDELRADGSLTLAIEQYKRTLFLFGKERTPERAQVYLRLAQVLAQLERSGEALNNYEKALRIDPLNDVAFKGAIELLCETNAHRHADALYAARLSALTEPTTRAALLRARVGLWLDQAGDLARGEQALRELLAEQPEDVEALRRMVETLHALGRHRDAIEFRCKLADLFRNVPARRARILVEAARAAGEHLDAEYAVDLAHQALTADPSALDALEIASELLVRQKAWDRLAAVYEAMLDQWEDDRVALDLARKLGFLARDILGDAGRAARAFELALALDEQDISLRHALAELYESLQDWDQAIRHCRVAVSAEPGNAQSYHRAFSLFKKAKRDDTAWNAASVLDFLGEADINESVLADTHRPDGLLPVRASLTEEDWRKGLLYAERDRGVAAVLEAVSAAAIEYRLTELKKQKQYPILDRGLLQDSKTSTTTLARTMVWAAQLLNVQPPALYVYPQVKGGLSAASVHEPSALACRSLGSGLSAQQLAFLWGRHLTFFRSEHYLLVFYPTAKDLASVLLAAMAIGEGTAKTTRALSRRLRQRVAGIRSKLSEAALETLRKATRKFPTENATQQMMAWAQTVELAAGRGGLLACGDLSVAADLTQRYPTGGQLTVEARVADLMSYCVSEEYEALRRSVGAAIEE